MRTRLISVADAPVLARLLRINREFLAPWEPLRSEDYLTAEGQRAGIEAALQEHAQGGNLPHVVLANGTVVGRITLNGIVRGAFQSCSLGYWVAAEFNGRGLATDAVRSLKEVAFDELGLHRIQAETLLANTASQRVLARNGFEQYGMAPKYLKIAGRWQDCLMFQCVNG